MDQEDIKQIQADAEKAVSRQFRDAAEDDNWKPTGWTPEQPLQEMIDDSKSADKKAK